ncbi:hypothetical protein H6P81_003686 [Aristolochia fimbriata]|uniref:F-box protein n=1 Tax=Aristolochia fimbriata TaxID=158543 RepID=A0AAV7FE56_ARIFI|nr:hypothetical protein H6P81_003686 [Aristolochia fimbriata]
METEVIFINELPEGGILAKVMAPAREPPWEVVDLVSRHLDARALAMASCVSKSWNAPMSSDDVWGPICLSRFPSLSALRRLHHHHHAAVAIPYRRLYCLAHSAAVLPRPTPPPPLVSLAQLFFAVDILDGSGASIFSLVKPGLQLHPCGPGEVFRFEVEVSGWKEAEGMRVMWTVVLEGWRGVFAAMKGKKGAGRTVVCDGRERWFTEELPCGEGCCCCCCVGGPVSGLMAEVGVVFGAPVRGEGRRAVERLKMGVMSVVNCRYVTVDEALRYFQRFLLPENN